MRHTLFLLLCLLTAGSLAAQQCNGNLGENIFTEGDFGSDTANVVLEDPGIAPGFFYDPAPPPNDGEYVITNNTGRWQNIWGTWRKFGDNSDDPNGYMMVINASVEPGLFYEQVVDGLCENTLYQFSVDVTNLLQRGRNQLLPNVSFLIDGDEYDSTGPIPEDEEWKTFSFPFTTAPGQTTLVLALRNNAPGGVGNDLALDNISFRACGPGAAVTPGGTTLTCANGAPTTLTAAIDGDQFPTPALQWQRSADGGTTWEDLPGATEDSYTVTGVDAGDYTYRYLLANSPANLANPKCHIISEPKLLTVLPETFVTRDTVCAGTPYPYRGRTLDRGGVYEDTLVSSRGCDSILRLELAVVEDPGLQPAFTVNDPSCSYLADGSITLDTVAGGRGPYSFTLADGEVSADSLAEGTYAYTVTDYFGCAATDSLRLTSPNAFTIDLGDDHELTLGESARIPIRTSAPATGLLWSPPEVVDCDSLCNELTVTPGRSLTLSVLATSAAGCVATDSVDILVNTERLVFIPSAISPNGDGVNDIFRVFASVPNVQAVRSLRIFDRWGGVIFDAPEAPANEPAAGWDGYANGKPVPAGPYVYVAEVVFLDGVVQQYSGTVTVVY